MGLRRRSVLLLLSACAAALGAVSVLAAHGVFAARGARRSSSSTPAVPVPKPITPTFRQHLLQLLGNFTALADAHGLEYWMCSGTLLGAIRDGGFISWVGVARCACGRLADCQPWLCCDR